MSAPVTVTLSRDWLAINAAKVARECSEAHITFLILDAKQDIAALTLARQQAASASNAQIAELREALLEVIDIADSHGAMNYVGSARRLEAARSLARATAPDAGGPDA